MSAAHRFRLQLVPQVRGDCLPGGINEARPCVHATCKWHLDRMRRRPEDVTDWSESCVLDVADRGGMTLEEIAAFLGITREGVRQVEVRALEKVIPRMVRRTS